MFYTRCYCELVTNVVDNNFESLGAIQCSREYSIHFNCSFMQLKKPLVTTTFLFLEYVRELLECLSQRVQSLGVIGQNDLQLLVNGIYLLVHWAAKHSKLVIRLT